MNSNIQLPSAKAVVSTAAFVVATTMLIRWIAKDLVSTSLFSTATSVAGTTMFVRSFANEFVPSELRQYVLNKFHYLLAVFNNEITIVIDEYEGLNKNSLFYAAETYLSTIFNPSTTRFRVSLPQKEKKIHVSIARNQQLRDEFCGIEFKWIMVTQQTKPRYPQFPGDQYSSTETRSFELSFDKKYRNKVLDEYLPYILERSKSIKQEMKTLKLSTLTNQCWQSVNLDHPFTFETLAMDEETKKMVIDDLERFLKRREFYRRVGKAWKRGYLLYGPPGTGKSSLIAAMANYLKFDVYDLELTSLMSNSDLRRLLTSTANRSILVVEDIDVSIDLTKKRSAAPQQPPPLYPYLYNNYNNEGKVTLSGLLNFIDGLWSSCGDERIIVFTTNHKDKLDPALLRPGRMDLHIHMSYCTPCGFKMLASTYLGITRHPLIKEVERMIETTKVTPAEVGEQLLKSDDLEVALRGLIEFIEKKEFETHEVGKTEVLLEPEEEEIGASESVKASPENAGELLTRVEAKIVLKGLMEVLNKKNKVEVIKASEKNSGESSGDVQESSKEGDI